MRRLALLLAVAAAIGATTAAVAASSPTPILTGPMPLNGAGFGHAKPRTIFLGGDPTGLMCNIRWLSWGGDMAIGQGQAWYVGPNQGVSQGHAAPAVVVLWHIGTWRGRPAYKRYHWYFPGNGHDVAPVRPCKF